MRSALHAKALTLVDSFFLRTMRLAAAGLAVAAIAAVYRRLLHEMRTVAMNE
jgi:hypothetical protein